MIKDFSNNTYKSKIRIKKDYRRKKFFNPYFQATENNESTGGFNTKLYLKIILAIFIIYIIIYSNLFKIEKITINGADLINKIELEQIIDDQIDSWRWYLLPQRNLLFVSKGKIIKAISEKYGLDGIEVKRGWKTLIINIKEKVTYLIINNGDHQFFVDQQGIIIKEIPPEDIGKYENQFPNLMISNEINIGTEAIPQKMVEFILSLNSQAKDLKLEVKNYKSGGPTEITLITTAGWQVHFDINNDLNISMENLGMVLNDRVKDISQLEYIDLRFGDKIYYK